MAPATVIFPIAQRPVSFRRFDKGIFLRLPPTDVSSTSTGPENNSSPASKATRMRCAIYLPCRLLRDDEITVQFHAGYTFEARRERISFHRPLAVRQFAAFQDCPRLEREQGIVWTITTTARHAWVLAAALHVRRIHSTDNAHHAAEFAPQTSGGRHPRSRTFRRFQSGSNPCGNEFQDLLA